MSNKYAGRLKTNPKFSDKNQFGEKVWHECCVNEVISRCISSDF